MVVQIGADHDTWFQIGKNIEDEQHRAECVAEKALLPIHRSEVTMKLRHMFAINLIFALFFGVSCSLFPYWVFQLYGIVPDNAAIWTTRLVGGSILGFATLMWFGWKTTSVDVRKAIALALLIQDTIGCVASLEIQLTGSINVFGWFSLALYGILALIYAFFLFVQPQDC